MSPLLYRLSYGPLQRLTRTSSPSVVKFVGGSNRFWPLTSLLAAWWPLACSPGSASRNTARDLKNSGHGEMREEFLDHGFEIEGKGRGSQVAFSKPYELLSFLEAEICDIKIRLAIENVLPGSPVISIDLKKSKVFERIRRTRAQIV